ncbi:unnamed protein product [Pelagomonas calceolata]|uniref:Uncharacterized protein n=2 Tax=Pelagomonas calceolata TaxID=35677 RepID=A0A8J2S819_9STRA|nr:unnamed protein product [Pelagomonas calceolata]
MDSSSNAANDVESMSIKEMKALITKAGLSHTDCFEKSDLRQRAREALAKTASAETQLSESDEIEDSENDDAPPAKRAKADDAKKPHVYALLISTGQTSLEDTSIIGLYKTWADAIKKAKHVLAWGESGKGGEFWNPVENDGMIPLGGDIDDEYGENLEDYNDKTDKYRTEPKRSTDGIEVASATNGQGDYGNMSMCIQKVALP